VAGYHALVTRSRPDRRLVLVLNAGSSSLKYEVFDGDGDGDVAVAGGEVSRIGQPEPRHRGPRAAGGVAVAVACPDHAVAVGLVLEGLRAGAGPDERLLERIGAVGHRVVHGGPTLSAPVLVDDGVEATLERFTELAPLHNGPALAGIRAARAALPGVPHVAVFDTGFHRDLPAVARTYALPRALRERHALRRYGFHGISCEYVVRRLDELGVRPARRTVVCHLGAGASVTAIRDGRSVDTSMGFTPLEGLVMATRSGDVDPGLLLHLLRHPEPGAPGGAALERVLEHESGLRGLAGRSGDYAELEPAAAAGDAAANLALEVFAYRVRKYLGAYWAVLGGVDVVAFTGGIGEHGAAARARILAPLAGVGWRLDVAANAAGPPERAVGRGRPAIWVIPAREAAQVSRHVRALLGA
jgi:acetate kinase